MVHNVQSLYLHCLTLLTRSVQAAACLSAFWITLESAAYIRWSTSSTAQLVQSTLCQTSLGMDHSALHCSFRLKLLVPPSTSNSSTYLAQRSNSLLNPVHHDSPLHPRYIVLVLPHSTFLVRRLVPVHLQDDSDEDWGDLRPFRNLFRCLRSTIVRGDPDRRLHRRGRRVLARRPRRLRSHLHARPLDAVPVPTYSTFVAPRLPEGFRATRRHRRVDVHV